MSRSRSAAALRRAPLSPRAPRRLSGPVRPVPVPGRPRSTAPSAVRTRPPSTPPALAAPGLAARVRALPDHRLLDTLLRSRAWIWLLGVALGGIVAMQVSLLGMNAGISRAVADGTGLEHSNSALEEQVAELSSGDRVRAAAQQLGLLSPDAGSVAFVTVRRRVDPSRAAQRMTAPSEAARQTLATDGRIVAPTAPTAPATTQPAVTQATTAATPSPVAPVAPAATAIVAPAATTTVAPVATSAPPAPAATAAAPALSTGGAVPAP